jgi:hypothetical protein
MRQLREGFDVKGGDVIKLIQDRIATNIEIGQGEERQ